MACDEQAEAIYEVIEALAAEGIVTNMDDVVKEFEGNSELSDLGLSRADIAKSIVEVEAWRASEAVHKAISNLSEIKGEARIEDRLRARINALQNELGTIPVDSPIGPAKRKRMNSTIAALQKELKREEKKRGLDKKYQRRIEALKKSIGNLDSQISDLEQGIDITREKRTPKEEAEEIEKLKAIRAERTRERSLLEQIARQKKGEVVEEKEEPGKAPVSKRIAALAEERDEWRRRRQLLNQMKDLQKQLQTGEFEIPMSKEAKEESEAVEALRWQRDLMKKQISSAVRSLEKRGAAGWISENIMGAYKTSRASIDWSMVMRQGYKPLLTHPWKWGVSKFATTYRATRSEEYFQDKFKQIMNSPEMYIMHKGELELTDPDGMMGNREDAFAQTGWLEQSKITNTLLVGKAIRMSNRAYTHYLNEVRVQAYMDLVRSLSVDGKLPPVSDLKVIGRFVNVITGRGDPGNLMQYGELLNNLFFSYRFTLSQFQFLELPLHAVQEELKEGFGADPTSWAPTDLATRTKKSTKSRLGSKEVRRKIMTEYARILGGMGAVSTLGFLWNQSLAFMAPGFGDDDEKEIRIIASGVFGPQPADHPNWQRPNARIDLKIKDVKDIKKIADIFLKSKAFKPLKFNKENDKKYRIRREKEAMKLAESLAGKGPVWNTVTMDDVVDAARGYAKGETMKDSVPVHKGGLPLYYDPRSSEFQKWRVGDRRVDMMGGFAQGITLISKFLPFIGGKVVENRKGEKEVIDQWKVQTGGLSVLQFLANKVHPLITAGIEYGTGRTAFVKRETRRMDAEGLRKFEPNWEWVADDFIPFWNSLFIQEARELIEFEGITLNEWTAAGILMASAFLGSGSYRIGEDRSEEEGVYITQPKAKAPVEKKKKVEPAGGLPGRRQ